MIGGVLLPLVGLAALAWIVPGLQTRLLPEGIGWLAVIGALSGMILMAVSGLGFVFLYGAAGGGPRDAGLWHFLSLAARASLVWAPVMVLSLADRPRRWTTTDW